MAEETVEWTLAPMTRHHEGAYFSKSSLQARYPHQDSLLLTPSMAIVPDSDIRQTLLWLTAGALICALLLLLGPILTPFVAAAIIGYVLNPGVDWLAARGLPRALAVMTVMVLLVLLIAAVDRKSTRLNSSH